MGAGNEVLIWYGSNARLLCSGTIYLSDGVTPIGGGTPGGSTKQIQYNNAGAFGADSLFVWDFTNHRLGVGLTTPTSIFHVVGDSFFTASTTTQKGLIVKGKASSSVTTFEAQSSSGTVLIDVGSDNKFHLRTDMQFHNVAGGTILALTNSNIVQGINTLTGITYDASTNILKVNPAGSDSQIQFNSSSSFGASANLVWDNVNNRLGVNVSPAYSLDILGKGHFKGTTQTIAAPTSATGAGVVYANSGSFLTSNYVTDMATIRTYKLFSFKNDQYGSRFYSSTGITFGGFGDDGSVLTVPTPTPIAATQNPNNGSYGPANSGTTVSYRVYRYNTLNGVAVFSPSYAQIDMGPDNNDGLNYGVDLSFSIGSDNLCSSASGSVILRDLNGAGTYDYFQSTSSTSFTDDGSNWTNGTTTFTPTSTPNFYQISLAWTASSDPDLLGYRMFFSLDAFTPIATPTAGMGLSVSQNNGATGFTADGKNFAYTVWSYQVISGQTIYTNSQSYSNAFTDDNSMVTYGVDVSYTGFTADPSATSQGYVITREINAGAMSYRDLGNITSFTDDNSGWTVGTPVLTPKTGYNIKYIDLGVVTTFTDTSSNITLTTAPYVPTPVVGNPSRVLLTDTDRPLKVLKSDGTLVYSFPPTDGTSGQIPFTDGSGVISWGGFGDISGTLSVAKGGTGATSFSGNAIAFSNGAATAISFNGNFCWNSSGSKAESTGFQANSGAGGSGYDLSSGTLFSTPEWNFSSYAHSGSSNASLRVYNKYTSTEAMWVSGDNNDVHTSTGDILVDTAGKGLRVKEGSNAKMGLSTLVAGTVVVSTTAVTANSRIFLTAQTLGTITVPVGLYVSARTATTSFTILSGNLVDTSTVAWFIVEPS